MTDQPVRAPAHQIGADGTGFVGHLFPLTPAGELSLRALLAAASEVSAAIGNHNWRVPERVQWADDLAIDRILAPDGSPPLPGWQSSPVAWGPRTDGIAMWRRPPGCRASHALPRAGDVALRTSGTSGMPRYAIHTWDTLRANAESFRRRLGWGRDDAWLATLAWGHVGGLAVFVRSALAEGRLAFAPLPVRAPEIASALKSTRATQISLVPAMLHDLLNHHLAPPSSLKTALIGGAPAPPALLAKAVQAGWPVAVTYGLTEAGSAVALAGPKEVRDNPACALTLLDWAEAKTDPKTGGLSVRGPAMFRGHVGDRRRRKGSWFNTGDLAELVAGDSSPTPVALKITGRLDQRFTCGGANVDPQEVAHALSEHPEVEQAAVTGLPDDRLGSIPAAAVVPSANSVPAPGLEARLKIWARTRLSGPSAPRIWRVVPDLPRTATGKVDQPRLRALLTAAADPLNARRCSTVIT